MKTIHLLAAACAALSTAPLAAQMPMPEHEGGRRPMPSPDRMFDRIDANHDGSISRAEFMSAHQRMMERRERRMEDRRDGPAREMPPRR